MKYEVAIVLILAAAVSAGSPDGMGHPAEGDVGHAGSGHWAAGHHSNMGRSLVAAPVIYAPVAHAGLVGEFIIIYKFKKYIYFFHINIF